MFGGAPSDDFWPLAGKRRWLRNRAGQLGPLAGYQWGGEVCL